LYNGNISASVAFCLSRSQQKKFPNFGGYTSAKKVESQPQDRSPVAEKNRFQGPNVSVSNQSQQKMFNGFDSKPSTCQEFPDGFKF
jgi:hypothetical protein